MPRYTIEEIKEAQELAAELHLYGCGHFCTLHPEHVRNICNGIGPEWMMEPARVLLDKRHPTMKIPAMIHDVQYTYGTGTDDDFHAANHNLYLNGVIMAKQQYAWYNPVRYLVINDARKLANICDMFGKKAYREAIASREDN